MACSLTGIQARKCFRFSAAVKSRFKAMERTFDVRSFFFLAMGATILEAGR
jgi:hypothetical protein